jgi:DNA-binding NarL/FixJ family response regulator
MLPPRGPANALRHRRPIVAEGRSNKEGAAALFVTVKTVESNLTRVYEKLGVRSRTRLASRLATARE